MHCSRRLLLVVLVAVVGAVHVPAAHGETPQIARKLESGRKPFFEETTLWANGEDGVSSRAGYHVFGLVQAADGTVLAFSEARLQGGDHTPHHLVAKRSTDGGRTWSKNIYIEKADGSFWKANGQPGKLETWTNHAPVVDRETGRVFYFYALNEGTRHQRFTRVFYRYSDDNGLTWCPSRKDGTRIEVTKLFENNPHGWTFHMPGPGHGIQLRFQHGRNKNRNGRLVIAVWHRHAVTANPRLYGVSLLVSDDHGKTWRHTGDAGIGYGMNEGRIVELADGRILLNARGGRGIRDGKPVNTARHRVCWHSRDAGETFGDPVLRDDLTRHACDSGMVRYAAVPEYRSNCLLFSRPGHPTKRAKMTVSMSTDEGKSWKCHKLIYDGPSGYSDLVVVSDRTIGLLYEKGGRGQNYAHHVAFARFNYEYLMREDQTDP